MISRGKRRQGEFRREKWTAERFFRVKILSEKENCEIYVIDRGLSGFDELTIYKSDKSKSIKQ